MTTEAHVRAEDPCHCDHDFTEHTRKVGYSPYANAGHSDIACTLCRCDDYMPIPWSDPYDRRHLRLLK